MNRIIDEIWQGYTKKREQRQHLSRQVHPRLVNDLGTSQDQKTATLSMNPSSPTLMVDLMGDLMSEVMTTSTKTGCRLRVARASKHDRAGLHKL